MEDKLREIHKEAKEKSAEYYDTLRMWDKINYIPPAMYSLSGGAIVGLIVDAYIRSPPFAFRAPYLSLATTLGVASLFIHRETQKMYQTTLDTAARWKNLSEKADMRYESNIDSEALRHKYLTLDHEYISLKSTKD